MIIREVLFLLTFCETATRTIGVRAESPLFLWGSGNWVVILGVRTCPGAPELDDPWAC